MLFDDYQEHYKNSGVYSEAVLVACCDCQNACDIAQLSILWVSVKGFFSRTMFVKDREYTKLAH